MALKLREYLALPEDPSSVPSSSVWKFTTTCTSLSGGCGALFWLSPASTHTWHPHTDTHTQVWLLLLLFFRCLLPHAARFYLF